MPCAPMLIELTQLDKKYPENVWAKPTHTPIFGHSLVQVRKSYLSDATL